MATQAGRRAEVHRPSHQPGSRDHLCEVSTFDISGLILNQTSRSSEPNVLGSTVCPIWGAGRGRSFCTGLSSSCVFLGSFLFPQRLSRLLWGCSPSLGPREGVLPAQYGLPHQFLPLTSRLHTPSKPCFALSSLDTSPCPAPSVQASCH